MNASYQCLFGARWRFGSSGLRLFGASGWFFGRRVAAHDGRDSNARGRGVGLKFKYAFLQIREIMDKHDGSYCTVTGAERTESLPPHMYAALGCLHPPRTRMFCAPQHTQADGSEETAPFGYVRSGFRRRAPRRRTNVPTARARRADCFEPAQIVMLRRARDCAPSCSAARATAHRGATARCARFGYVRPGDSASVPPAVARMCRPHARGAPTASSRHRLACCVARATARHHAAPRTRLRAAARLRVAPQTRCARRAPPLYQRASWVMTFSTIASCSARSASVSLVRYSFWWRTSMSATSRPLTCASFAVATAVAAIRSACISLREVTSASYAFLKKSASLSCLSFSVVCAETRSLVRSLLQARGRGQM
jgi:hypothetical protein